MASTADTSIRLRSAAKASGRSPHFRALVELATDGVVIVNESGQVRYANAAFRQWIGEPAGTEETTDLLERVVAGDRGALAKALEAVGGGGGLALRLPPFRIHARDGTVRELEGTGTALPARNGTGNHVLHLRDVTEQRLADLRLRRSEESARIINDFATSLLELKVEEDVLWDVVRNCVGKLGLPDCVVYVVDRPRSLLVQRAAWGPKAPVGRAIVNPLEIPLGQGIVGAVGQSGKPELVSDTRADPRYIVDDAPRLSELAVPILVDGDVVGVIDAEHPDEGFFREHHLEILTAIASLLANQLTRVWAEQALRRLNADLERRVHERTSELEAANARLQREVSERARAQRIQQALYQISEAMHQSGDLQALYRRLHEIIGTLMPARNFYLALCDADDGTVTFPYHVDELDPPPPPRRGYRGMTEYVLRTGRACLADLGEIARLKESDEYQQTVAPARIWLGVPLAVRGQTFGVMAVQDHHDPRAFGAEEKQILSFVADQTALAIDRKRAGQDLQRALDQERELVRLKGNFVNLVSHEFRTPIGVILGSAQVLESYFDRLEPGRRAEHLGDIADAARHMAGLIDEVLLLGRIEAGRLPFQPRPLNVGAFLRRLADEVTQATGGRNPIAVDSAEDLPPGHSDETLLRHVFSNLLTNAVKYSPPGSPVSLTVAVIGTEAVVTVRDQGIGIPAEDQRRLFEVFYRGGNVGELPGTGLGLVIVKRCVEVHGGEVRLNSQVGRGTTVIVRLPLFRSPEPPAHSP